MCTFSGGTVKVMPLGLNRNKQEKWRKKIIEEIEVYEYEMSGTVKIKNGREVRKWRKGENMREGEGGGKRYFAQT
jgi:hypothetical protein